MGWSDDGEHDGSGRRVSFSNELGGEAEGDIRGRQREAEAGNSRPRLRSHARKVAPFSPERRATSPDGGDSSARPVPQPRPGPTAADSPASSLQSIGALQGSLGSDRSAMQSAAAGDPDDFLTSVGPARGGAVSGGGGVPTTHDEGNAHRVSPATPGDTLEGTCQARLVQPSLQGSVSVPSLQIRAAAVAAEREWRHPASAAGTNRADGLPPRWHRHDQSINDSAKRPPDSANEPAVRSGADVQLQRMHGAAPSAAEAAVEGELQGRLMRGQQLVTPAPQSMPTSAGLVERGSRAPAKPRHTALPAIGVAAKSGSRASDPAGGGGEVKAPAASQSRSGAHHSAVSSGDGTSTHADSPRVVEHAIAGDLFIAQTEGQLRRRSMLGDGGDVARDSAAVKASPRGGGRTPAAAPHKLASFAGGSDVESDILEEDDLKDEDQDTVTSTRWQNRIWVRQMFVWLPIVISVCFLVAGIILVIFFRGRNALYFDAWRWCFFICAFVPIYWVSRLVVHLLVLVVEAKLFTNAKVLFFLLSVRRDLGRMLRMVLWIPVSAALFGPVSNRASGVHTVYKTILRLLGCVALFWLGNIVKTVIARYISSHFHKEAHFNKMKDALEQEAYLAALSQPRQEHRVDDRLLGLVESGSMQEGGQLQAGQLDELRAERAASRRPLAFSLVPRAFRPRRAASTGAPAMEMERASTCPAPLASNGLHRTQPTIASVDEEGPLRPDSFSNAKHQVTTPQSSQRGVPSPAVGTPVAGGPRSTAHHSPKRHRDRSSTHSIHSGSTAAQTTGKAGKKPEKRDEKDLKHKVSLPGGAASELDVVMKLHKVEKHIRKNKLKVTLSGEIGAAGGKELSSKAQARRLAFYLFWNIKADFTRNFIVQEDLEHFLPSRKAARAFALLDTDRDGKVTLHNTRDAVIQVYKERKDLAATLKDTRTVVGRLELLIAFVVHIAFIFFYLLIFQVNVNRVWLTISSIVLACSFVFGNSIRNVFESVVFLFVVHPFDVGDALLVADPQDSAAGPQYHLVEEIMLLNTKVKRWDGACVYYPNSVLDTNPLINLSRSDSKWEVFKVWCDMDTPASAFDEINARIKEYLEVESGDFSGEFNAVNFAGGDPMKIQLGVFFEYTFNGVDLGRVNRARHGLFAMLGATLSELEVTFTMPSIQGHSQGREEGWAAAAAAAGSAGAMAGTSAAARPFPFR